MRNEPILEEFFRLENERKWREYEEFLAPDVVWTLYSSDEQFTYHGRKAYMDKIVSAYSGINNTFFCKEVKVSTDGKRIAATLQNSDGNISLDIFDFKDGLIVREWEYLMT